jgi:proteasome lid subunit RPN8/RPN11
VTDISSKLLEFVEADDLRFGEPEICGVITSSGDVVQLPNVHTEPVKGFHIEPVSFLAFVQAGAVATWHTHPGRDPNLSEEDMQGFSQWPALTHHIVGVRDGEPTVHSFAVVDGIVVTV